MRSIIAVSLVAALAGCATTRTDLPTQSSVDLSKYAGTWYEQARLPNRFQDDCASDVQADYVLREDGTLGVTNQCKKANGETKVATAQGRLNPSVQPPDPAKLQVRFAPAWTSWLPWVWGNYWIIKLAGDYEYSLVGTPDREYLWVLTREKDADQARVDDLLDYARTQGFAVDKMVRQ
ncbi:lipocalin family protein [Bordetella sp. 15P40C-2]|uniref:lipocalin family protein n=1 Tax=Bordetella sp. 15P40C-2 TaxID=2572246 RepID=UPI001323DEA1|nr:lipocalin family protein [Bordetella sp. 15P40C-2]MVW71591.1 lipocalin [Bordetella sp. 15P40C-2]